MADGKAIGAVLETQEWLEPTGKALQGAIKTAFDAAGQAKKPIENALNGVWLGHTLHPALVQLPVGAWTSAAVLDVLESGGKTEVGPGADACVAMGLVGAVGAALSGMAQWYPIENPSVRKTGAAHALLNGAAVVLYGASYAARKKGDRVTGRALGWLGFGAIAVSAYLGGQMTYDHGMGVDHAPQTDLPKEFTPVLDAGTLPENTPTKAVVGTTPLVLVRRGETIHALADACSHFGGPLSEGRLGGDCITCPWHGSRFRLTDGLVEDGPATFSQPCFETRVRDGKIEVRADAYLPQNRL